MLTRIDRRNEVLLPVYSDRNRKWFHWNHSQKSGSRTGSANNGSKTLLYQRLSLYYTLTGNIREKSGSSDKP